MKHSRTERSTEAPMDYQWTNRTNTKGVWAFSSNDFDTPRKRPHEDLASSTPMLETPAQPSFGSNQNFPFLFQQGQASNSHSWTPPALVPSTSAFIPPAKEEIKDVDMSEASPGKAEETKQTGRPLALGGLKRIYNQRQSAKVRRKQRHEAHSDESDNDEDTGSNSATRNTSNHYTLNLSAPPVSQGDTPYLLLGYLQFFFNFSLISLFLYLVVQFILTVQRDVEQRISEYSMEIVQEITLCALQHKNNLCSTNPVPAMVQQCANWETCMNRDPTVVGRAKVGAELIAEVVNGFVEPISWKTLAFLLTSLSFLTVFINTLLSLYRARYHPIAASSQNNPPTYSIHPYAPHHYGNFLPGPEVASSSSRKTAKEDVQNPTRRRRLEGGVSVKVK
ncbi:Di-sulfide bridge nucleocytoplasmic transport domain-containing protein [Amanita rubescens]|nr:Di-sulfide bridge nucleocytoplasmic transport domain-containing protein [Amanita rubescens]